MTNSLFAPTRLTVARQRRALTKKALAEKVKVCASAITEFEGGSLSPSPGVVERMAAELGFPPAFFYGDEIDLSQVGPSSFRSLRSMSARVRGRVEATGAIAARIISPYLDAKFVLPSPAISLDGDGSVAPSVEAEKLRSEWCLGQSSIPSMVQVVEKNGIRVYWIDERSATMDAISFWEDDVPHILLCSSRPGERQRMSIAHELGHLALHRDMPVGDRQAEADAFAFASSFLLPEGPFRQSFRRGEGIGELFRAMFRAKREWGVSAAAALRRSLELGMVTQRQYASACRELSVAGWRKAEPQSIPHEHSALHEKVFAKLREDRMDPLDVARELSIGLADLLELMPVASRFQSQQAVPDDEPVRLHMIS